MSEELKNASLNAAQRLLAVLKMAEAKICQKYDNKHGKSAWTWESMSKQDQKLLLEIRDYIDVLRFKFKK